MKIQSILHDVILDTGLRHVTTKNANYILIINSQAQKQPCQQQQCLQQQQQLIAQQGCLATQVLAALCWWLVAAVVDCCGRPHPRRLPVGRWRRPLGLLRPQVIIRHSAASLLGCVSAQRHLHRCHDLSRRLRLPGGKRARRGARQTVLSFGTRHLCRVLGHVPRHLRAAEAEAEAHGRDFGCPQAFLAGTHQFSL